MPCLMIWPVHIARNQKHYHTTNANQKKTKSQKCFEFINDAIARDINAAELYIINKKQH